MEEYCNGVHWCQICNTPFECEGESSMHNPSPNMKGSGRCNGPKEQFCNNHEPEEYRQKHKELGDL